MVHKSGLKDFNEHFSTLIHWTLNELRINYVLSQSSELISHGNLMYRIQKLFLIIVFVSLHFVYLLSHIFCCCAISVSPFFWGGGGMVLNFEIYVIWNLSLSFHIDVRAAFDSQMEKFLYFVILLYVVDFVSGTRCCVIFHLNRAI